MTVTERDGGAATEAMVGLHWRLRHALNSWEACGTPLIHTLRCRIEDGVRWLEQHSIVETRYAAAERHLADLRFQLGRAYASEETMAPWREFLRWQRAYDSADRDYIAALVDPVNQAADLEASKALARLDMATADRAAAMWADEHPELFDADRLYLDWIMRQPIPCVLRPSDDTAL
ncbi:MAG: hypothetical protein GX601_13685 [Anaerolineales bacterium]|nr:hypothetical protein [Anaerolineales bacterium]